MTAQPTAAIVPYRSTTPTLVQFAADGVAADMRVEPLDRRRRTSLYTIRLASSDDGVTGRLIGVLPSGDAVELGDLLVAPGSIGGARLTVTAPHGGYRAVYLEIRSARLLLHVEALEAAAPAPRSPGRRRHDRIRAGRNSPRHRLRAGAATSHPCSRTGARNRRRCRSRAVRNARGTVRTDTPRATTTAPSSPRARSMRRAIELTLALRATP